MPQLSPASLPDLALEELRDGFHRIKSTTAETLCQEILEANRSCLFGVGREGLSKPSPCGSFT
jgi:hypothetical protein